MTTIQFNNDEELATAKKILGSQFVLTSTTTGYKATLATVTVPAPNPTNISQALLYFKGLTYNDEGTGVTFYQDGVAVLRLTGQGLTALCEDFKTSLFPRVDLKTLEKEYFTAVQASNSASKFADQDSLVGDGLSQFLVAIQCYRRGNLSKNDLDFFGKFCFPNCTIYVDLARMDIKDFKGIKLIHSVGATELINRIIEAGGSVPSFKSKKGEKIVSKNTTALSIVLAMQMKKQGADRVALQISLNPMNDVKGERPYLENLAANLHNLIEGAYFYITSSGSPNALDFTLFIDFKAHSRDDSYGVDSVLLTLFDTSVRQLHDHIYGGEAPICLYYHTDDDVIRTVCKEEYSPVSFVFPGQRAALPNPKSEMEKKFKEILRSSATIPIEVAQRHTLKPAPSVPQGEVESGESTGAEDSTATVVKKKKKNKTETVPVTTRTHGGKDKGSSAPSSRSRPQRERRDVY